MDKDNIIKQIKKEMIANKTFNENATFSCFSDSIFTYEILKDEIHTEINIIADDTFFANESVNDLFNKKKIGYLEHSIYIKNGENDEKIGSLCYNR